MRTVQETLRELDHEDIVSAYLEKHHLSECKQTKWKLTFEENYELQVCKIENYIMKLSNVSIANTDLSNVGLFFASLESVFEDEDIRFNLIHVQDLQLPNDEICNWGYINEEPTYIAGCLIAETEKTKGHLPHLMAEILYNVFFFDADASYELDEEYDNYLRDRKMFCHQWRSEKEIRPLLKELYSNNPIPRGDTITEKRWVELHLLDIDYYLGSRSHEIDIIRMSLSPEERKRLQIDVSEDNN